MIDYNDAFRKIDRWCRENIKYPVRAELHNLRMDVRASRDGVLVIDDSYFNGYGFAFTADGKDWSVHYTGSTKSEEHLLPSYRTQYIKKFVENVGSFSFSVKNAYANEQEILYVTERCVFRLGPKGLILTEIAPGIDLQTQILDLLPFEVEVAEDLKTMVF